MQRSVLCRSRRELSNAYFLAKFCFDTAENDPCKVCPIDRCKRSPPTPQGASAEKNRLMSKMTCGVQLRRKRLNGRLMAPSGSFDCVRPVGAHRARIDRCGRSGVGVSSSFASVLRPMGLQEISDTRTSTRRSDGLDIARKKSEEPRTRATFHPLDLLDMLERHDRVEDAFENASV